MIIVYNRGNKKVEHKKEQEQEKQLKQNREH